MNVTFVNVTNNNNLRYRYLGTGSTFSSIALYFARGETTVGAIVRDTSRVIWQVLKERYMKVPDREKWLSIAERFESLWNLPNCIGALDSKHVKIKKFANTGSTNFNYKLFNSVVLMACSDADGTFITIETGFAGRNSDGGIFNKSALKYWVQNHGLDIPPPSPLKNDENGTPFPYYFVSDEAFPLSRYLMRPYPRRILDNVKRIFNYRLSRGRKTVECTFGMACEKFAVLNGPIGIRDPENVDFVIKAACVLHHFFRKREGLEYTRTFIDDSTDNNSNTTQPLVQNVTINRMSPAKDLRNYLANYFLKPRAALPWQWKYAVF